jgi:hypothetical protein
MTPLAKKWRIIANVRDIWTSSIFLSPLLSKHNSETQNSSPTQPNNCKLREEVVAQQLLMVNPS